MQTQNTIAKSTRRPADAIQHELPTQGPTAAHREGSGSVSSKQPTHPPSVANSVPQWRRAALRMAAWCSDKAEFMMSLGSASQAVVLPSTSVTTACVHR